MSGRVEFSSGYFATVDAVVDLPPALAAAAVHLSLDDYLKEVDCWSRSAIAFPYGVTVDREAKTITQPATQGGE